MLPKASSALLLATLLKRFGKATDAKMPTMIKTTIISIKVKPLLLVNVFILFSLIEGIDNDFLL